MEKPQRIAGADSAPVEHTRRDFLRKSAYAAYATPVIAALLVEKASAAVSKKYCENVLGGVYNNPAKCCDTSTPPDGVCDL